MTCQRGIEALLYNYYVDEQKWIAEGVHRPLHQRALVFSVNKATGASIELGVFQNGSMPEISAVIFSTCATWGKVRAFDDPNPNIFFTALRLNLTGPIPHCIQAKKSEYQESLLDGLRVYHNPDAINPLAPVIFRSRDVMQSHYSRDAEDWEHEQRDGQLLFRTVVTHKSEG